MNREMRFWYVRCVGWDGDADSEARVRATTPEGAIREANRTWGATLGDTGREIYHVYESPPRVFVVDDGHITEPDHLKPRVGVV